MNTNGRFLTLFLAVLPLAGGAVGSAPVTNAGARYATDAYPGFDSESEIVAPSKKEPRWFSWWNGPKRDNAKDQLAYCAELIEEGNFSKAAKELDALVREWPVAPEAAKAQKRLAEILLNELDDSEEAFAEYRYLFDFYLLHCDFTETVDTLYKIANQMRRDGKTIVFFHFDNTVDVRRAYEACVLRAPGAHWVREAMLAIAELREEEGKPAEAVKVYENLRNLHAGTAEAREAFGREAKVRMGLLDEYGYNIVRCRDTIGFLKLALRNCELDRVDEMKAFLETAQQRYDEASFRAAAFYDSKTRTPRSSLNAYERYVAEFPEGAHADEARARIESLREGQKGDEK